MLTALILAGLAWPVGASANVGAAFVSPTGNVVCWTANDEFGAGFAGCTARITLSPRCAQDVSAGWNLTRRGIAPRPVRNCRSRSDVLNSARYAPVLGYGRSARLIARNGRVIRCTSRPNAMVCIGPRGSISLNTERVRAVRR